MSDTNLYFPSTVPGKHWHVYTYKPDGRPGYATAVEGKYSVHEGHASFEVTYPTDRILRVDIAGRMTQKAKLNAVNAAVNTLKERGLIANDAEPI